MQQWIQSTGGVELMDVIGAADVTLADEYLWNGPAPGASEHFLTQLRLRFDIDFLKAHALGFQ